MNEQWTEFLIWYGLKSLWQIIRATEFLLDFSLETLPQRVDEINQQIINEELSAEEIFQHQWWLAVIQMQLHNLNNRTTFTSQTQDDYNDGWSLWWRGWENVGDQTIISLGDLPQTSLIESKIEAWEWEALRESWSERISTVRQYY